MKEIWKYLGWGPSQSRPEQPTAGLFGAAAEAPSGIVWSSHDEAEQPPLLVAPAEAASVVLKRLEAPALACAVWQELVSNTGGPTALEGQVNLYLRVPAELSGEDLEQLQKQVDLRLRHTAAGEGVDLSRVKLRLWADWDGCESSLALVPKHAQAEYRSRGGVASFKANLPATGKLKPLGPACAYLGVAALKQGGAVAKHPLVLAMGKTSWTIGRAATAELRVEGPRYHRAIARIYRDGLGVLVIVALAPEQILLKRSGRLLLLGANPVPLEPGDELSLSHGDPATDAKVVLTLKAFPGEIPLAASFAPPALEHPWLAESAPSLLDPAGVEVPPGPDGLFEASQRGAHGWLYRLAGQRTAVVSFTVV